MKSDCKCKECSAGCERFPGRFLPGEVEKVAEFLHLSVKELFDRYLRISQWYSDSNIDRDVFILAPVGDPFGRCVFFKDGLCSIHSVNPYECAETFHDDSDAHCKERNIFIAKSWIEHQDQVFELLGHTPLAVEHHRFEVVP
jgi:Fe-S-cluster containining protein